MNTSDELDPICKFLGPLDFESNKICYGKYIESWDELLKNAEDNKVALEVDLNVQDPNHMLEVVLSTHLIKTDEESREFILKLTVSNLNDLMAIE